MTLIALVLASLAFAGDRSDAERADRSDGERADRSDAREERADERSDRAEARSRHARATRGSGHHTRAHSAAPHGHARYRYHHVRAPYRGPRHVVVHRTPPPPPAHAHATVRRAPEADHDVSIMLNLVDVPAPLFSAGVEVAMGRHFGLVGNAGLGVGETGALYDVGADLRGYVIGDFDRGIFLGGGAGVTNHTPFAMGDTATTLEGFVGAKYTASFGLAVEGSLGVEGAAHEQIGGIYPTAKIGIGWAF